MSQDPKNSGLPDGESASPAAAEILFVPAPPMEFISEQEPANVACTTCKAVTQQFDYKIAAMPADISTVLFDPEFMAAMGKLVRRLVFCTHCGTYRLTS